MPGVFHVVGFQVEAELSAGAEVAFDLAVPAGQAAGIGECRPQVIDIGVVALFDAHDARAVCRSQAAQDAGTRTCVASHLVLLSFAFPGLSRRAGCPAAAPTLMSFHGLDGSAT